MVFVMFRFWFGFVILNSPDPQTSPLTKKKVPKSDEVSIYGIVHLFRIGFFSWVRHGTIILLVGRTRVALWANEHIAWARNQHKLHTSCYVRTAYSSSEKGGGPHGRWFAPYQATISPTHGSCGQAMSTRSARKAGKVMCVYLTLRRSFYPLTSSIPRVRADSSY